MNSRRVLGFSAEHGLRFTRNAATSGSAPLQLSPALLSGSQRCTSGLKSQRQCRAASCRDLHTSSLDRQSLKVSPEATTTTTTTKNPNASASIAEAVDLNDMPVPLSHQFRSLMRLLTHSVVVCTSTHLTPKSGGSARDGGAPGVPRAMTMSSFTSLALHPTPAVSFNIATPSRTLDAIKSSGFFNIHVLAADVSGAKVANWCRQGNEGALQLFEKLREECKCDVTLGGESGGPAMLQGPGVLHVLRCRLLNDEAHGGLVKVRDHVIVVGEVLEIVDGRGQDDTDTDTEQAFGLAYADTKYREPGRSIRTERLEMGLKERR
ncbi:flavin reductase like domain-containing protein [Rhypophila decipiens]|uniref:Flavin reductase like domain-containing protein n=1 Tax=Rhypophila decipiens TaxID=261697 RepID=A0AAN7B381_9PEZI|nr:flavin reductase like domain-containing protein [Rhypophila decipiens]